jgi:hypothetical protein
LKFPTAFPSPPSNCWAIIYVLYLWISSSYEGHQHPI